MPARKKQASEAGTPLATGRKKKTASSKAKKDETALPAKKSRAAANGDGGRTHDLVIVESPTKAKTINKYLGSNYKVLASYGHVRDLPRRRKKGEMVAGVNIEDGWIPTYVVENKDDSRGGGLRTGLATVYPDHFGAERMGDLRHRSPDTTRNPEDSNGFAGRELCRFDRAVPGHDKVDPDGGGLVEAEPLGLAHQRLNGH